MPLDDIRWDVEVFRVIGVHGDPVHQFVVVGDLLVVELLLKSCHCSPVNFAVVTAARLLFRLTVRSTNRIRMGFT